jgi:predicted DsbA family dithiol-disulfide isomerase
VADRFLRAYHSEGVAISDRAELERLAVEAGLDRDEVVEVLASDAYGADVRTDESDSRSLGVTGVPFFVVDGRYALSGAQPPEVMVEVIERSRAGSGAA